MAIKDLQPKQGKVEVEVDVVEKSEPREFQKFGNPGKVCTAKVKDETGEMDLTLWNEEIEKVNVGDRLKITNGYVNDWQGKLQLSAGRYGTLEVVGSASGDSAPAEAPEEPENVEEEVE
ncbi:MAG: SOSS complex subunit B family protein [archaeon]